MKTSQRTPASAAKPRPRAAAGSAARPVASRADAGDSAAIRSVLRGSGIRCQLAVSEPGDVFEREADRVGERVARGLPAPMISRLPASARIDRAGKKPDEEQKPPVRREAKKLEDERKVIRRLLQPAPAKDRKEDDRRLGRKEVRKPEDEPKLQRKAVKEEDERRAVRRLLQTKAAAPSPKPEDEKRAQRAPARKPEDEAKKPAQRQGQSAAPAPVEELAEQAVAGKGRGRPMDPATRGKLESSMGVDLGGVRVHDDMGARAAAQSLNARAFTHGSDIWLGPGESQRDVRLMAHEATHVVQQQAGLAQRIVQRDNGTAPPTGGGAAGGGGAPPPSPDLYSGDDGVFDKRQPRYHLRLKNVHLPRVKAPPLTPQPSDGTPLRVRPSSEVRSDGQAALWDRTVRDAAAISASLDSKITQAWHFGDPANPICYFQIGRTENYLVGNRTRIRDRVLRPYWTPEGTITPFQVDHRHEYQLGGADLDMDNLWLLDVTTNTSSGSLISNEIERRANRLVASTPDAMWTGSSRPNYSELRANHDISIVQALFDTETKGGTAKFYTRQQIADEAIQMGSVLPMNIDKVRQANLEPGPSRFIIFNNATGGRAFPVQLPAEGGTSAMPFTDQRFIPGFRPQTITLTPDQSVVATIQGELFSANPGLYGHGLGVQVEINRMTDIPQAGHVNFGALRRIVVDLFGSDNIQVVGFSPLRVRSVTLDDLGGVTVRAQVLPTIDFIRNADIELLITGDEISLQKTFSAGELSLPGPVRITGSTLTIALSSERGLAVDGQANFAIDRVGQGNLGASAETGTGRGASFAVAGRFNFDPALFDEPSYVAVAYRNNALTGEGTLSIGPGRIRGVRSGSLHVQFDGEEFAATGTVAPAIPGIEEASIGVHRTEEEGLVYEGDLQLSANPAIRSGSIHATLSRREEGWTVAATGTAQPAIPGIDSTLTISYADGAFTAEANAAYNRGMLSGSLQVGLTNRAIGENGQPTDTVGEELRAFGGGELTIRLTPWLQGTVGVRILPVGELELQGEIGLPSSVEIFARRQIDRSLLNIAVQVPIFPGIVAEIGGGLSAQAGIGPGAIDQLRLGIAYNPAHEENTRVTGDAHLNIPADAGLRLAVRAGIGLGITGASATGGLEIGGMLGLAGAAEASVHLDWTPASGLRIDAFGDLHAEPKFRFDISGYVSVRALGFSVYDHRWQFAQYEFGSNMRFGVRFPIHYVEGRPFDISLNDVEFTVPDVDPQAMLRGLISEIT